MWRKPRQIVTRRWQLPGMEFLTQETYLIKWSHVISGVPTVVQWLGISLQWLVLQWKCGFMLWLDTMPWRMWHCPSSSVGCSCGSDTVTGPGTSTCRGHDHKRKKTIAILVMGHSYISRFGKRFWRCQIKQVVFQGKHYFRSLCETHASLPKKPFQKMPQCLSKWMTYVWVLAFASVMVSNALHVTKRC